MNWKILFEILRVVIITILMMALVVASVGLLAWLIKEVLI